MSGPPGLLAGLRVVELGDGVAGGVAAATLARLGATVTTVVPAVRPRADHEPRLHVPGGSYGALDVLLDRNKEVVVEGAPEVRDLLTRADIVIEDAIGSGIPQGGGLGAVHVLVTAFGTTGPRRADPGGELVAQAAGGLLGTIEPEDGGRPAAAPGDVALRATGHVTALAALHGLDLHRAEGAHVALEVSAQEAVIATAALPECAHVLHRCPGSAGSGRYLAPSGLFPCTDGSVRITAVEDHQWKGMVAALGAPAWTAGLDTRDARIENAERIRAEVGAWTATRTRSECVEVLQARGVPSTPVTEPAEVLTSAQRRHRGTIDSVAVAGTELVVPGDPWRLHPGTRAAAERPGRVAGLRIAELTHVLVGPIIGALLGAMGASVTRIEDLDRLDIYRRTGPFADGVPGVERGAYFAVANHSKRSVAAAGTELQVLVDRTLSHTDVVIENVGSTRLQRLGIDPSARADEGTLTVRVSGFGCDGPTATHRAYANNVQSAGGLAWLTRDHAGAVAKLGTVLADPLTSVVGATVVAAWALGPQRDRGGVVDLAMVEVVADTVAEFVAAAGTGPVDAPVGADHHPYAPHGVYGTADGRWVAVAAQSDDEWMALVEAMGAPSALDVPEWREQRSRYEARRDLDRAIDDLIGQETAEDVVGRLVGAGVRAAVVRRGNELVSEPHLVERGFFPSYDHADVRDVRLVGLPWRRLGGPPFTLAPPPTLGSSTDQEIERVARR